jgi:hypothetical protein
MLRVLVTTTDATLRRTAASAFEELGCDVLTTDGGVECVARAQAATPGLVVLLPPLLWGSVAGVLAVLHDDPATRGVPVLILDPPGEAPFPRTPRLLLADAPEYEKTLPSLVERACARMRRIELAPAPDPHAP